MPHSGPGIMELPRDSEAGEAGRVSGGPRGRVLLKPGEQEDLRRGRRWVYANEVAAVAGDPAPGDVVDVLDASRRFLGRGYYNPRSLITVRLLTHEDEPVDAAFFRRRLEAAWAYRRRAFAGREERLRACRVVFGEADSLPALIVDRFGDVLSLQTLALGIDRWKETIAGLLAELLAPAAIVERNDAPVRDLEGLERRVGLLRGDLPAQVTVVEEGVEFAVDVLGGQKTGHFLDQLDNRVAARGLCAGGRVLDAFAYTGGFGLHAAWAGAREVVLVDDSEAALALAAANARRNGVAERVTTRRANAFDELRRLAAAGERFDVVILDPPAFAKSRSAREGALRGYKEINLRAMKLLPPGGVLVTASCSSHIDEEEFVAVVHAAAADAGRLVRLIERRGAGRDHPVLLGAPETRYLKCLICEVV